VTPSSARSISPCSVAIRGRALRSWARSTALPSQPIEHHAFSPAVPPPSGALRLADAVYGALSTRLAAIAGDPDQGAHALSSPVRRSARSPSASSATGFYAEHYPHLADAHRLPSWSRGR
jgi:hypothetical protein